MTEQLFPCPKCQQQFPMSQLHQHYASCQGINPQNPFPQQATFPSPPSQQQVQQWQSNFPQMPVQNPVYPTGPQQYTSPQMYIPPPKPEHKHIWFENDTYKVCLDQSCKQIKLKLRGTWFIFTRYIFKLFWIMFIGEFALVLWIVSATTHH